MPNSIFARRKNYKRSYRKWIKTTFNAKREDVIINVIGNEEKRSFFSILEPTK